MNLVSVDDMQTILDMDDHETADMPTSERADHIKRELKAFMRKNGILLE